MKTLKFGLYLLIISFMGSCFTACSNDDDKDEEQKVKTFFEGTVKVDAKSYTDWVYFSFNEKKVVEVSDFANDQNWDLGIHRADFRTNGGKSGKGACEVKDMGVVDFASFTSIPTDGYVKDADIKIINSPKMPPTYVATVGNVPLTYYTEGSPMSKQKVKHPGAFNFDDDNFTYIPTNKVFIVKSADGKSYAKLIFTAYNSGVIDFKYQITTDIKKGFKE